MASSSFLSRKCATKGEAPSTDPYSNYLCNYCQENLVGLRITCGVCPDFDLCLQCFACGAELGSHKSNHRYIFASNAFSIFPKPQPSSAQEQENSGRRRASIIVKEVEEEGDPWTVLEDTRLLDAVEMYSYGNWKEIAKHIETKNEQACKERYVKYYINGAVGSHTWEEDKRALAIDHTKSADSGPLSPTLTQKLPPINLAPSEALMLGYMPNRDDYDDFDKAAEGLVSQIGDKSVEDEAVEIALKYAHVDMYSRCLREQVRRKRVARDYQLVSQFFKENPVMQFDMFMAAKSPTKMARDLKMAKNSAGPKQEVMDALKPFSQFNTCQEFKNLVDNICFEKELKVRLSQLKKYRNHGLINPQHSEQFEKSRIKRELTARKCVKGKPYSRLLPRAGDYSIRSLLNGGTRGDSSQTAAATAARWKKRKGKKSWARKKIKTGRRLLISMGVTLTAGVAQDQDIENNDEDDDDSNSV